VRIIWLSKIAWGAERTAHEDTHIHVGCSCMEPCSFLFWEARKWSKYVKYICNPAREGRTSKLRVIEAKHEAFYRPMPYYRHCVLFRTLWTVGVKKHTSL
jgi:hypothetical protein